MKVKTKGFGCKAAPQLEYQLYTAELKRRYLTDNSEMLLGTATIQVPKAMHDLPKAAALRYRTGQASTKREVWDAFAQAVCYCILCSKEGEKRGLNQIFLFDNRWELLERVETNAWEEGDSSPTHQNPLDDKTAAIAWEAFKRCKVQVDWLDIPVVA